MSGYVACDYSETGFTLVLMGNFKFAETVAAPGPD
jgi:hypothetical protein